MRMLVFHGRRRCFHELQEFVQCNFAVAVQVDLSHQLANGVLIKLRGAKLPNAAYQLFCSQCVRAIRIKSAEQQAVDRVAQQPGLQLPWLENSTAIFVQGGEETHPGGVRNCCRQVDLLVLGRRACTRVGKPSHWLTARLHVIRMPLRRSSRCTDRSSKQAILAWNCERSILKLLRWWTVSLVLRTIGAVASGSRCTASHACLYSRGTNHMPQAS
mmetsp:Transcript_50929/g.94174  ORF Transcript_50929/g.94174 Transcript_50929/m.94174 type:complete len:215 (+) Transcript_50929:1433-2077(+)